VIQFQAIHKKTLATAEGVVVLLQIETFNI